VAIDVPCAVGESGWVTTAELLEKVSRRTIANWVTAGKLVRLRPGVLALPTSAPEWRTRIAAALENRPAVASHSTALALWELIGHPPGPVHISVDNGLSARGAAGVVVHRSPDVFDERRRVTGLAVTPVERSIVDTWGRPGQLRRVDIRATAITAVRRRLCSARDIARELDRQPRLPGRAELARLVGLLAEGCQSELEIWGCLHVLRGPGMPAFQQQRRVHVAGETFHLDATYDDVLLAVEMDGAAWHGSREQRERDIRRDALLATAGWQTLRFGYGRMTGRPDACRREIRATYDARRRLIRPDGVR
jgi:very-short-patch-repair endonuclease/predicted transcriptional regulator of viral defense system